MQTLILGGYGNFGARICRALAHDADIRRVMLDVHLYISRFHEQIP